ncbi:MAG: pilus assembly protein N-terminal domain-containing protein [Devosiaceae bacterium]|nr:pilus assembly protein N-terminal domain-containing protein [Devosiaceae bacterium]
MAVVSLKKITRTICTGLICAALSFSPQLSFATEDSAVTVNVNMARILRIGSPAATVIIGNPGVADVTIQDPQTLVLTGRSFGHTNLIVLDGVGNPIADLVIKVVGSQRGFITVYQGSSRTTLACAPNCQPVIMLGDDIDYTARSISSSSMVASSANQ